MQAMSLAAPPQLVVVPLLVGERWAGDISALVATGARAAVRIERLTSLLDGLARPDTIERICKAAGGVSHVDLDYLRWAGVDVCYDPERAAIRLDAHEALDERESEFAPDEGFSALWGPVGDDVEEASEPMGSRHYGLTAGLAPGGDLTWRDDSERVDSTAAAATQFGVLTAETALCIANGVHPGYPGSIGWNWTVMGEEATLDSCFRTSP